MSSGNNDHAPRIEPTRSPKPEISWMRSAVLAELHDERHQAAHDGDQHHAAKAAAAAAAECCVSAERPRFPLCIS